MAPKSTRQVPAHFAGREFGYRGIRPVRRRHARFADNSRRVGGIAVIANLHIVAIRLHRGLHDFGHGSPGTQPACSAETGFFSLIPVCPGGGRQAEQDQAGESKGRSFDTMLPPVSLFRVLIRLEDRRTFGVRRGGRERPASHGVTDRWCESAVRAYLSVAPPPGGSPQSRRHPAHPPICHRPIATFLALATALVTHCSRSGSSSTTASPRFRKNPRMAARKLRDHAPCRPGRRRREPCPSEP